MRGSEREWEGVCRVLCTLLCGLIFFTEDQLLMVEEVEEEEEEEGEGEEEEGEEGGGGGYVKKTALQVAGEAVLARVVEEVEGTSFSFR